MSRDEIRKTSVHGGSLRTIRASPPIQRADSITIPGSDERGEAVIDDFAVTVRTRAKT